MAGISWPTLAAGARARASDVEAKFDWLEGNIVPMSGGSATDSAYDLGTSAARWRSGYFSTRVNTPALGLSSTSFISFEQTNTATKLVNGVAVNEFSNDGTLAGDSDLAVPTEKATKAYIDLRTAPMTSTVLNLSASLPRFTYSLTSAAFATLGITAGIDYLINISCEVAGVAAASGTSSVVLWLDYGQTSTSESVMDESVIVNLLDGLGASSSYRQNISKTLVTNGGFGTTGSIKLSLKCAARSGTASITSYQLIARRKF